MNKICPLCQDPQNYNHDPECPDDDYCEYCTDVEEILEFVDETRVIDIEKSIRIFNDRLTRYRCRKLELNRQIDKLKLLLAILNKQQMKNGLEKALEEFEKEKKE